jgi:hypothetical protein
VLYRAEPRPENRIQPLVLPNDLRADGVGFEPTRVIHPTRFPIVLLKPLGHPSLSYGRCDPASHFRKHRSTERVGFEPTDALRASRFSKPLPWAARAPLQPTGAAEGEPAISRATVRRFASSAAPSEARGPPHIAPEPSSQLPRLGSNQDSSDPESDVLPVTPRGKTRPVTQPRPDPHFGVYFSTGRRCFFEERETGLEPATLSLGS